MGHYKKIAFLFPGQGAQYVGMARDFAKSFPQVRLKLQEAEEILKCKLSDLLWKEAPEVLTQTENSQPAIFVTSLAIFTLFKTLFPTLHPYVCAGLSLGEYSALVAGEYLSFEEGLNLVRYRSQFMSEACQTTTGTMAAIIGLSGAEVEEIVQNVHLPEDLWIANFNTQDQVVISGTLKGVEKGMEAAKARGAKRAIPLQVHGAFHSGLMSLAEERLTPYIMDQTFFKQGSTHLVMNVPGNFVKDLSSIKSYLVKQVTHSVHWEQGIRAMDREGVDLFIEFGPGKTLAGMNKRIGVTAPTLSLDKVEDLDLLNNKLMES